MARESGGASVMAKATDIIRQCGALALDALTLGIMSKAAEREELELRLRLTFPDDWRELLSTMDRFDRASFTKVSPYIMQMWTHGICHAEEVFALRERCPAAFRNHSMASVIGQCASDILPQLAESLP